MNIIDIKEINKELNQIRSAVGKKTSYEKQHIIFLKKLLESSNNYHNTILKNLQKN